MAIAFNKLRDPKLQLTDKITFGKLKDCRVCDVIPDFHEYLIWCEKQGFVKFSDEVIALIKEQTTFKNVTVEESSQDNIKDVYEKISRIDYDWEDDVPF